MNWTALLEMLSQVTVKGSIMLTGALLAGVFLRKLAAARRYSIWITVLIALAVLPVAIWMLPNWRVLPKPPDLDWPAIKTEVPVVVNAEAIQRPTTSTTEPSPLQKTLIQTPAAVSSPFDESGTYELPSIDLLPLAWLMVATFGLLRLSVSAWHLRRLEKSLSVGSCDILSDLTKISGLQHQPRLLIGPRDAVPMVWGVLKPRLLLPAGFQEWPQAKLRGVILHELAHLQRGDPAALWLALCIKSLHWFNPLAWMTVRRMRADQERACDDAALSHGLRPSDYAQSLLDLSRHAKVAPGLALCALTITRSTPVEARVKAILNPQSRRETVSRGWLACLTISVLLVLPPIAMLHAIDGTALRGRLLDRNSVVLAESSKDKIRHYPHLKLASHVLGYSGKARFDDPTLQGRAGMEKQHDETLRQGRDVKLSLDARIQSLTAQAMRESGVSRGAALVLDPRTGEILASVSLPSYDPNRFIPSISIEYWKEITQDKEIPLLNRAVRGFSPGSAYMPLVCLAGIAAGVGDSKYQCGGSVHYGNRAFQCWISGKAPKQHGELGMAGALSQSCQCYLYQLGNAAGMDQIESMGHKIGFGSKYGICDYEDEGVQPGSSAWKKKKNSLSKADVAIFSSGQGMNLTSPLQLAVLAATIANRGKVPEPTFLKADGVRTWRADLPADGLPENQIDQIREAMRLVVNGDQGTGRKARSDQVVIAGKTGTTQYWRRDEKNRRIIDNRVCFMGFAPFDKPTFAFVILKEGGKSGGSDCAPIAKRIVEESLGLPADGSGEVTVLK